MSQLACRPDGRVRPCVSSGRTRAYLTNLNGVPILDKLKILFALFLSRKPTQPNDALSYP